ncbi:MAG TPA: G1 family glutamic endopeptidase [Solirubrobacteraceae bacterium]|jgi:hypothetical protein|nr:G1 family glutamic endopeptidase [Solirubrobacteraceae bacterium]
MGIARTARRSADRGRAPRAAAWLAAALAGLAAAAPTSSAASAQASISTNWAGYVAVPAAAGSHFDGISGSWTVPATTCRAGHEAFSAVWVGLGGYNEHSHALEQVGTDADCTRAGAASYRGWFELLPAGPVNLGLRVRPGDRMLASVSVAGQDVTLRIRDLTSGRRFQTTRRRPVIDASSAEWIVEAPSACVGQDTCAILPLADFGQVAFSSATASVGDRTGPIEDPGWLTGALELQQRTLGGRRGRAGVRVAPTRTLTLATPSPSSSPAGAFSVTWAQQTTTVEQPGSPATLPGFGGGAP